MPHTRLRPNFTNAQSFIEQGYDAMVNYMKSAAEGILPSNIPSAIHLALKPFAFDHVQVEIGRLHPCWLIIWFKDGHDTIGMEYEFEPITETYALDGCWINELIGSSEPGVQRGQPTSTNTPDSPEEAWDRAMKGIG